VERPKNFLELRTCRQIDRLERTEGTNSEQRNNAPNAHAHSQTHIYTNKERKQASKKPDST
jgi:hypothetical protein